MKCAYLECCGFLVSLQLLLRTFLRQLRHWHARLPLADVKAVIVAEPILKDARKRFKESKVRIYQKPAKIFATSQKFGENIEEQQSNSCI